MSEKLFDPAIPRHMYWSNDIGGLTSCPECGTSLENEFHSYLMHRRNDTDAGISSAIIGTDGGYFCPNCLVVVLDRDEFCEFAAMSSRSDDGPSKAFLVSGFVDHGSIPEDKQNVPLGETGNPVPHVPFTNFKSFSSIPDSKNKVFIGKKKLSPGASCHQRKIGKNQPCPCGSGKKFKKCCGSC